MVKAPLGDLLHLLRSLTCGTDDHLERAGRLCGYRQPKPSDHDIESLQTWFGRGSIARVETKYLNYTGGRYSGRDLLTLADA